MAQPPPPCQECMDLMNIPYLAKYIRVKKDDVVVISDDLNTQARRRNCFLTNLNAMWNHGGGVVIFHLDEKCNLDKFEQSVSNQIAALIPDDSPFHKNFERHIVGRNHLTFRVIQKERKLSTLFFNTKVPQSCCVVNPTQGQMRYLMNNQEGQNNGPLYKLVNFTFKTNTVVQVQKERSDGTVEAAEDFHEAINIQAKKVPDSAIEQFHDKLESEFFNKNKPGTYLPKYVAAFTKLRKGGSIFLGIKEDKKTSPKWEDVEGEEKDQVLDSLKGNFKLYKKKNDDRRRLYYVAEENQQKEVSSGKYLCEGVKLDPRHEEAVSQDIKRLIKKNTYWLPKPQTGQPPNTQQTLVKVTYPRVQDNTEFCVVKIKVKRYEGMVFHDKDGPQAYTFIDPNSGGNPKLDTMSINDWSEKIKQ